jgi:hypothetical protein
MAKRQAGIRERQRWLYSKEREGFMIEKVSQHVYDINDKKSNIRFSSPRSDNVFWFWHNFQTFRGNGRFCLVMWNGGKLLRDSL